MRTSPPLEPPQEFYMWARDVFTPALLPSEYYEGTAIPEEKKRVTYYNRIVGGVRMRQQRVTPNAGCTIKGNVITNFFPTKGPDEGIERVRKCAPSHLLAPAPPPPLQRPATCSSAPLPPAAPRYLPPPSPHCAFCADYSLSARCDHRRRLALAPALAPPLAPSCARCPLTPSQVRDAMLLRVPSRRRRL